MRRLIMLVLLWPSIVALPGCGHSTEHSSHGTPAQHHAENGSPHEAHQVESNRPSNQVAVLTVWAGAENLEPTAGFYEEVLGLRRVGTSTSPFVLDTDGTFVVIMVGKLEPPHNPQRRWPMFALTVSNLDQTVEALRPAGVDLPWGIEEFGAPEPSSRYVMFYDPAGNLIEIVEWL
jgi:catechol 2,3-dioxygenase-like lactoylglutathione lyase family enzyme